ncbi:MAG: hypothetical protein ACRES9_09635 [Gammaproteobacteria bacterium]
MNLFALKIVLARGFLSAALVAAGGVSHAAQTTKAPVAVTRLVPVQGSQTAPNRVGVLLFFNFTPASKALIGRLVTWAGGVGQTVVLDREPLVGDDPAVLARAFIVSRTLGVTASVLPALFELGANRPDMKTMSYADKQKETKKLRAAVAGIFANVGIVGIEFNAAWHSKATDNGMVRARVLSERYGMKQAPALIVNGIWKLTPEAGASSADVLAALDRKVGAAVAQITANQ